MSGRERTARGSDGQGLGQRGFLWGGGGLKVYKKRVAVPRGAYNEVFAMRPTVERGSCGFGKRELNTPTGEKREIKKRKETLSSLKWMRGTNPGPFPWRHSLRIRKVKESFHSRLPRKTAGVGKEKGVLSG